jgi:hypothetical protein
MNTYPVKILTASTTKKLLPKVGHYAHFTPRDKMVKRAHASGRTFRMPAAKAVPVTVLPVDSTGNGTVSCPMDNNSTDGDCGEAMAAHVDNIFTFGQGKPGWTQSYFAVADLLKQYLAVSGGDNGLDEDMVVNQIWKSGIGIAGNPLAIIWDSLDMDVTNVALAQFAIDQFYAICMAWSVPDLFIQNFAPGSVFTSAMTPDPNNGHFTPLADVVTAAASGVAGVIDGCYRLYTWGGFAYVSPAFIASVQPQCFIVFSPRQFNAQGYDSKGRHITTQAALWQACGGSAISPALIASYPPPTDGPTPPAPLPPSPPTPIPPVPPAPIPWTPAQVQSAVDGAFGDVQVPMRCHATVAKVQQVVDTALAKLFGQSQIQCLLPKLGARQALDSMRLGRHLLGAGLDVNTVLQIVEAVWTAVQPFLAAEEAAK